MRRWFRLEHAVVCRELTKKHETFLRGSVSDVLGSIRELGKVRGEITLLVQGTANIKLGSYCRDEVLSLCTLTWLA
jgi:16S rRNA C1402 (ribose-2'-O) methylase RsmI